MISASLKPGTVVGNRYRVERHLGGGEWGPTYQCRDLVADVEIVLRPLSDWDGGGGPSFLRREFSFLSQCRHPHLAHLLDFGVLDRGQTAYLVRQYIHGVDILQASAGWSIDQVLDQLAGICRVLQFLHSRGAMHRHLKPSNVIVSESAGGEPDLKVLDFGLERRTRKGKRSLAAVSYAPPEILLGNPGNYRSDLYSLGILAYQLLTRRLPFDDEDEGYLIQKHLQGKADMRPIERLRGGAGLAQVIHCLLEKNPENRPSSAEEVIRLWSAASGRDFSGGVSGPIEAYFSPGRFVGREQEMCFLQERARRVRETGRGLTTFLIGESGAGKSRCLEELRTWALLEDWRVVEAACLAREDRSYGPYRRILAHAALLQPATDEASSQEAIFRFEDSSRTAEDPQFELSSGAAAGPFRDQLTREVVRLVCDRPTLLMLHDFHWADEATVAVLDYLTTDIQTHPIFLCVSLRPGGNEQEPLTRLLALTARQQRAESLTLGALSALAVEEMIAGITGGIQLARESAAWVHQASGGNPFFVEEILKNLVDRSLLRKESGKWRLATEDLLSLDVPSSVAAVLRHRLSQLSPGACAVTQWLALFRRAVPRNHLGMLGGLKEGEIEGWLRELLSRQIVREGREGGGSYEFQHALISEVIAEDLPAGRKRRMHQRIGEMLEGLESAHENVQELALHFTEGKCGVKAVGYALRAARSCKADFANQLALRFYEYLLRYKDLVTKDQICQITIEAADTYCALGNAKRAVPILQSQLRTIGKENPAYAIPLYAQLSRSYQYLGELRKSEQAANEGIALQRKSDCENDAAIETQLLSQLAFCLGNKSQPLKALAILKCSISRSPNPRGALASGHLHILLSGLYWVACEFDEGANLAATAIKMLEPIGADHLLPMAYSHLGINLAGMGKFSKALAYHEYAVLTSKRTRSLLLLAQALCNLTETYCRSGAFEKATESSQKVARISLEIENQYLAYAADLCLLEVQIATTQWSNALETEKHLQSKQHVPLPVYVKAQRLLLSAFLRVAFGDFESAVTDLCGLENLVSSESPIFEASLGTALKTRILCWQGRFDDARELLEKLETRSTKSGWAYQAAISKQQLAEVLMAFGDYDAAKKRTRDSLRLAKAMPAIHLQAKAHYLLGKIAYLQAENSFACACDGDSISTDVLRNRCLIEIAVGEFNQARRLSNSPHMLEISWQIEHMLMRAEKLNTNSDSAIQHAREVIMLQAAEEERVPKEILGVFRNRADRRLVREECESSIRNQMGIIESSTQSLGEMEAEHLRILCQASSAINSIRDLDQLLKAICDSLYTALAMEKVLVILWDEKAKSLKPFAQRGLEIMEIDELGSRSYQILKDVFRTGSPFVSADFEHDPRIKNEESEDSKIGSLFCAPLIACGHPFGLLYASHNHPFSNLSISTINFYAAFGNIAAVAIDNAQSRRHLMKEKHELEHYLRQIHGDYPELVGKSATMEKLKERIGLAADSPLDVLIYGESGTGKELVARALHRTGRRLKGNFIALDCGSLSDSLVESELFGYRKGAFTGATENRPGLFEAADGGIIFLDEISNLSLRMQGKLLRVLQEREIRRIGETLPRKINVQVIAATNRDLRQAVFDKHFREDLYFRLCAMEIKVPALHEHKEDIPLLIEWFLSKVCSNEGGRIKHFCIEAYDLLMCYYYPGNVRELKNIVEGSYYSTLGDTIDIANIPSQVRDVEIDCKIFNSEKAFSVWQLYKSLREGQGLFEGNVKEPFLKRKIECSHVRQLIHFALAETGGRYREAFRLLGIPEREYAIMMQFLKRNNCYLDFRPYRKIKSSRT